MKSGDSNGYDLDTSQNFNYKSDYEVMYKNLKRKHEGLFQTYDDCINEAMNNLLSFMNTHKKLSDLEEDVELVSISDRDYASNVFLYVCDQYIKEWEFLAAKLEKFTAMETIVNKVYGTLNTLQGKMGLKTQSVISTMALEERTEAVDKIIRNINKKLQDNTNTLHQHKMWLNELEGRYREAQEQNEKFKEMYNNSQKTSDETISCLQEQLAKQKNDNQLISKENNECLALNAKLQGEINNLNNRIQQLEQKQEQEKESFQIVHKENQELKNKNATLQKDLEALQSQNIELILANATVTKQVSNEGDKNRALQDKIITHTTELSQQKIILTNANKNNDSLKSQIKQLQYTEQRKMESMTSKYTQTDKKEIVRVKQSIVNFMPKNKPVPQKCNVQFQTDDDAIKWKSAPSLLEKKNNNQKQHFNPLTTKVEQQNENKQYSNYNSSNNPSCYQTNQWDKSVKINANEKSDYTFLLRRNQVLQQTGQNITQNSLSAKKINLQQRDQTKSQRK